MDAPPATIPILAGAHPAGRVCQFAVFGQVIGSLVLYRDSRRVEGFPCLGRNQWRARTVDDTVRKEGLDAGVLAALLQGVWPGIETALDDGAMMTVTERSIRVRRLPIVRT